MTTNSNARHKKHHPMRKTDRRMRYKTVLTGEGGCRPSHKEVFTSLLCAVWLSFWWDRSMMLCRFPMKAGRWNKQDQALPPCCAPCLRGGKLITNTIQHVLYLFRIKTFPSSMNLSLAVENKYGGARAKNGTSSVVDHTWIITRNIPYSLY